LAYCYDNADRLTGTSTTGAPVGASPVAAGNLSPTNLAYDAHGNTTLLANQAMLYDVSDQHVKTIVSDIVDGNPVTSTVVYTRDVSGAIVERSESDGTTTKVYRYTAGAVLDGAGAILQRTVGLPGGVTRTDIGGTVSWFYPNQHGDVILQAHTSTTLPSNGSASFSHYDAFLS
jgi:hypothetical protein